MNKAMYNLVNEHYIELFNIYCKYNKNIIKQSASSEDRFNDKILKFMELDLPNPTLDILKYFLKNKTKSKRNINTINVDIIFIEYLLGNTDNFKGYNNNIKLNIRNYKILCEEYNEYKEIIEDKLKYLFIDYKK